MTQQQAAMRQALEALEYLTKPMAKGWDAETQMHKRDEAITALRQALEQQPAAPAIPEGWKLVPAVPTNEWINNLAKMQTGSLEEVPFMEIHQCIAELLAAAPEQKGNV